MATHFSILGWRIPIDRGPLKAAVHGIAESQVGLSNEALMHATSSRAFG